MIELPTGTVTFLFTDLESSTRLWEEQPEAMGPSLTRHDEILRGAVERNHGRVVKTAGDGVHAVFVTAHDALDAAVEAQLALVAEPFDETCPLRARMGVHTCEAELRDGDYYGSEVNRAARLMSVAHGQQIVVSLATSALLADRSGELVDLGEHRLRDLGAPIHVFQVARPGLPTDFPRLRSMDAAPGNLPRQTTTFVGRDDDVVALEGFLRSRSLVTLTGVGGVGKTRLAIQAAAQVLPDFPDGAWLCELASLSDPDAFWDALAASLGVFPSPGRSFDDAVLEYLGPKQLLLVLDNCEHLLGVAAGAVTRIADGAPGVVVLATSREGLAVAGEQIVAVPTLGLPALDASLELLSAAATVRLFVDRALSAKSDFVLTDRNAPAVARLCRRLDGIPLAIELAAARVRSLNPENLVARLDQRFKLLTRGSRAALERHQTLRNTIDWSYDLLGDPEREALNRLSVFPSGADIDAAEAVVSSATLDELDVADVLSQLVDKSLVNVDDDGDGDARYRLFESIRQYAQERLEAAGDADEVRRRHADHYVARADAAAARLRGRDQVVAATETIRDVDDYRAVVDWATETSSVDHALRLVAALAVSGMTIGYVAMDWAATAVEIPGASDHPLFPIAASWAAMGAVDRGDLEVAETLVARGESAEALLGTRQAAAAVGPAVVAYLSGDPVRSRVYAQEWVDRARESGDPYALGQALILYGSMIQFSDPERAVTTFEEAVRIGRGDGIATVLAIGLATYAALLPDDTPEDARRVTAILDEAIEVGTSIGDRHAVAGSVSWKAVVAARQGDHAAALRTYAEAAAEQVRHGTLTLLGPTLIGAASSFVALGHLEQAAVVLGRVEAMNIKSGMYVQVVEMLIAAESELSERLGAQELAECYERGAALGDAAGVAYLCTETDRLLVGDAIV